MLYDVWQQYTPCKIVGFDVGTDGERIAIYRPAVFHRGQVAASSDRDAITKARSSGLASRPMVRAAA